MKEYDTIKLECLDICYSCIDRDIVGNRFVDYETSFEQVFLYDYPRLSDFEKAVWCFTLIIHFARSGMITSKNGRLETETRKYLQSMDSLSLDQHYVYPEQFYKDANEVSQYMLWLDAKRKA